MGGRLILSSSLESSHRPFSFTRSCMRRDEDSPIAGDGKQDEGRGEQDEGRDDQAEEPKSDNNGYGEPNRAYAGYDDDEEDPEAMREAKRMKIALFGGISDHDKGEMLGREQRRRGYWQILTNTRGNFFDAVRISLAEEGVVVPEFCRFRSCTKSLPFLALCYG